MKNPKQYFYKDKFGVLTLPNFEIYCNVIAIKTAWRQKYKSMEQNIESPKVTPYVYSQSTLA